MWVYILTNHSHRSLYIGVTSNPARRIWEHKQHMVPGFTAKYRISKLIYVEEAPDATTAIAREKQLKGWRRAKKEALIASVNPEWEELTIE